MKKAIIMITAAMVGFCGFTTRANAQDNTNNAGNSDNFYNQPYTARNSGSFDRNTSLISIGYGFPNEIFSGYWDNGYGPVYVKYERGIIDEIGIGAYLGLGGGSHKNPYYNDHVMAMSFGMMGYYHFNKFIPIKQLDVYAGLGIGFVYNHYKYDSQSPYRVTGSDSNFSMNGLFKVGGRWYFTPKFGVYLELGYDALAPINLGVSFRF